MEKQNGYISGEAEWVHLCRTRIVTFVERQSDYLHLEGDILHLWISGMVTFLEKQSGYIPGEAEWLHSSNFSSEYIAENPGECFINPRAVKPGLVSCPCL